MLRRRLFGRRSVSDGSMLLIRCKVFWMWFVVSMKKRLLIFNNSLKFLRKVCGMRKCVGKRRRFGWKLCYDVCEVRF